MFNKTTRPDWNAHCSRSCKRFITTNGGYGGYGRSWGNTLKTETKKTLLLLRSGHASCWSDEHLPFPSIFREIQVAADKKVAIYGMCSSDQQVACPDLTDSANSLTHSLFQCIWHTPQHKHFFRHLKAPWRSALSIVWLSHDTESVA